MSAPFETSPALLAPHGFFGREGGLSEGEFASLNMSSVQGDDPAVVSANRTIAANAIGFAGGQLRVLKQVHSNRVHVQGDEAHDGPIEADAMVSNTPGVVLGILTADCTPILLADATAGVIGAAHAGWRGAVDGIASNTVAEMVALGARADRIVAVIGPTITQPNYEVGAQFRSDFLALHPGGEQFFVVPEGGQAHFDLPGFVASELAAAGVGTIEQVGGCTYGQPERYFSHRYITHHGGRTGRQIALIALP